MAKDVIMPVLGMNQDTAVLVSWLAGEGDDVVEGEPLMEVETDKAVMALDAPASGTLVEVSAAEGDDVPVGSVIARILADGEARGAAPPETRPKPQAETAAPAAQTDAGPAAHEAPSALAPSQAAPVAPGAEGDVAPRPAASPLARRTSAERGLELAAIDGSGPGGAVVMRDVEAAASADATGREAGLGDEGASEAEVPAASAAAPVGEAPALAGAATLGELERRVDAGDLTALLATASADVGATEIAAALARFLAASVARRLPGASDTGVTLAVDGPQGRHVVGGAERLGILALADRLTDEPAATPAEGPVHAVLAHAGDTVLDALRPGATAALALGVARPDVDPASGRTPLVLTLRYDPGRVETPAALAVLSDVSALVAEPRLLAVAY